MSRFSGTEPHPRNGRKFAPARIPQPPSLSMRRKQKPLPIAPLLAVETTQRRASPPGRGTMFEITETGRGLEISPGKAANQAEIAPGQRNQSADPRGGIGETDTGVTEPRPQQRRAERAHKKFTHPRHHGHESISHSLQSVAVDKKQSEQDVESPVGYHVDADQMDDLRLAVAEEQSGELRQNTITTIPIPIANTVESFMQAFTPWRTRL